jgi:fumarylpyruvate hydrolase
VTLHVNDELKQQGDLADLIWSIPEIVSFLSEYYTLAAGDLIFTGTPAGVGPVVAGDRLVGRVAGLADIDVTILPAL